MKKQQSISAYLRALADVVDKLEDWELAQVLKAGRLGSLIRVRTPQRRVLGARKETYDVHEQARVLLRTLGEMASRDDARDYLEATNPTRRVLTETAKLRDLHISKQDTVGTLREKLVANVVGSRLDSAAIRGEDVGRGRED